MKVKKLVMSLCHRKLRFMVQVPEEPVAKRTTIDLSADGIELTDNGSTQSVRVM